MTAEDLKKYLINPDLLSAETAADLKEMVREYPYFEILHMLYLKNLRLLGDLRFADELKKAALLISDRALLYRLIYDDLSPFVKDIHKNGPDTDRTLQLIDAYMSDKEEDADTDIERLLSGVIGTVELSAIIPEEEKALSVEDSGEKAPQMKHQDLIDRFIEISEDPEQSINKEEQEEVLPPVFENSISNSESYFTETLAKIYIRQHRYERALEIIRKLNLNYPEKSVYFAPQIEFLEKLIANDKKH